MTISKSLAQSQDQHQATNTLELQLLMQCSLYRIVLLSLLFKNFFFLLTMSKRSSPTPEVFQGVSPNPPSPQKYLTFLFFTVLAFILYIFCDIFLEFLMFYRRQEGMSSSIILLNNKYQKESRHFEIGTFLQFLKYEVNRGSSFSAGIDTLLSRK